jgi:diadenosine tetraphosphate (Ap4A) HIT family hydrolase
MPETAADYDARIREHLDADGRLGLPEDGIPYWEIFPFEAEGLRLKAIEPALEREEDRFGEDPATCRCSDPDRADEGTMWENDRWRLVAGEPSGAPVLLVLLPKEHFDLATLPDDLAAEMGRLMTGIAAAVEALPSVARCHLSRWGDGGAHAHFFFMARPALLGQFRGTCMALWDDFLPPVPQDVFDANVAFVVERLTSTHGGGPVRG